MTSLIHGILKKKKELMNPFTKQKLSYRYRKQTVTMGEGWDRGRDKLGDWN